MQVITQGYAIGEVSCPTRYLPDSSSINLQRSIKYGLTVITTTIEYKLSQFGAISSKRFPKKN